MNGTNTTLKWKRLGPRHWACKASDGAVYLISEHKLKSKFFIVQFAKTRGEKVLIGDRKSIREAQALVAEHNRTRLGVES